jgi:hypothetical protein
MAGRTDLEALVYQMSTDVSRLVRQNEKAVGNVNRSAAAIEARYKRAGKEIGQDLGRLSLVAGAAFGAITAYAIKAASDAGEMQNAFDVAFGAMAKEAGAFAQDLAKNVGRSVTDVQGGMSRMQLVLTGMGLAGDQALRITETLSARAIDIGSLWNVSDAEAFQAIVSGISGEAEPMKRFGAVINEAAIEAELLRLGFKGNAADASDAAKAIARANLILQKTTSAAGDAERTVGSTANQVKRAKAEFHDAAVELGNQLLPAFTKATQGAADLVKGFSDLDSGTQIAALALLALVAAGGPIASVIGGFIKLIKYANLARLAIMGVVGAQAAAGAAGVAGGAAGAVGGTAAGFAGGRLAAGASAAGPVGVVGAMMAIDGMEDVKAVKALGKLGRFKNKVTALVATDAEINLALSELDKLRTGDTKVAAGRGGLAGLYLGAPGKRAAQDRLEAARVLRAEQARRASGQPAGTAAVQNEADAAAATALAELNEDQKVASGGAGKGKKGPKGKSAEQLAAEQERLAQQALDREERTQAAIDRANQDVLQSRISTAVGADERLKLELQAIAAERKARNAELDRQVQQKEIDAPQAQRIKDAEEAARLERERVLKARASAEAQRDQAEADQMVADMAREILQAQEALATTQVERSAIQLRLLAIDHEAERLALEAQAADTTLTAAKRKAARDALAKLPAKQASDRAAVDRGRGITQARQEAGGIGEDILKQDSMAERYAAMYAEIDRMRRDNVLNEQQAAQAIAEVHARYSQERLANASSFFGTLAQLSTSGNKKISAIGKAAAIVQATIDGFVAVQKALASAPPPFNIALAAAIGAVAAVNVAKIAGVPGFEAGGYTGGVRGQPAGMVHGEEFVVRAGPAAANRSMLEAMNRGMVMAQAPVVVPVRASTISPQVNMTVDLRGANGDETIRRIAAQAASAAGQAAYAAAMAAAPEAIRKHHQLSSRR